MSTEVESVERLIEFALNQDVSLYQTFICCFLLIFGGVCINIKARII